MPNIYLTVQGANFNGKSEQQFDVMVGDNPPSITGGYAKWTTVSRPLRRGLTILQGYDPAQMSVEVRFGSWAPDFTWDLSNSAAQAVEADIDKLEWMSGGHTSTGNSPAVYLNAYDTHGRQTDLIPPAYQNYAWVINGLQWGKALRNPGGYRVWQDAVVTFLEYINFDKPAPKQAYSQAGGYFIARQGADTPKLIAASPTGNSPIALRDALAWLIVRDARNASLKLRSINAHIKRGKKVWVPAHQT